MDEPILNELYDIEDTASYILRHGYTRVALQFPDQLLKVSVIVSSALKSELRKQSQSGNVVRLYMLADTTYGSCCADEIAAAHVNAECIIHYGHTCLSQMSKLPVWYVFGKATIDVGDCVHQLVDYGSRCRKRMLVVFDLEYAHAIPDIESKLLESQLECAGDSLNISFADLPLRETYPTTYAGGSSDDTVTVGTKEQVLSEPVLQRCESGEQLSTIFNFGGLSWTLPTECKMEDIVLVWIGQEGPALTNIMLTFNASIVVLYDPEKQLVVTDVAKQSKFLLRRYYLVERAKDANIVGIVIGTLGVAGYREMVHVIKRLVKESGKKCYTLAMGRPNPAKLANFPECDIFVLVACAQTALLDSKDYMVPVITPFEAIMAWKRGSQWTGAYSLDFRSLKELCDSEAKDLERERSIQSQENEEARFSFIRGSYIEENITSKADQESESSRSLCLAREAEQALQLQARSSSELVGIRSEVRSGVEYFVSRAFQGLEMDSEVRPAQHHTVGRKGRAAAYNDEPAKQLR